jgi:hypothetical protein
LKLSPTPIAKTPNSIDLLSSQPKLLIFGGLKEEAPIYIFTKGISFTSPFAWEICA